ncbi:MAG: S1 RNA-binding domain-containing protein [Patescibacteria group bacterium]
MVKLRKADIKQGEKSPVMETLLSLGGAAAIPKVNEVVNAKVISVAKGEVLLDIDGLTTGIVRGRELADESGEFSNLSVGDEAQATVLELENELGLMELSFRSAGHRKAWGRLEDLRKSGEVVEVRVTDANRGGLIVTLGRVAGFLPVSQLTFEHYPRVEGGNKQKILERLSTYVGQVFKVKVIDVKPIEEKLIVSEKAAALTERISSLQGLKGGMVVEGKVSSVVDFGAFVEFMLPQGEEPAVTDSLPYERSGGEKVEGLIHISELAWHRVDHPKDIVSVGMSVRALVIGIEGGRVSLSLKRLEEDPWKTVAERFHVGDRVKGKVVKLNHFGAFVELDHSIHGLAHISELSSTPVTNPLQAVAVGQEYEFRVTNVDPASHRLGLSLRLDVKAQGDTPAAVPGAPVAEPGSADSASAVQVVSP